MSEPKEWDAKPLYEKLEDLSMRLGSGYRASPDGVHEWFDGEAAMNVMDDLETLSKEVFEACRDRGITL